MALHRVFDSPRDRIVFDVSHQSYVHKMLTGRAAAYLDPDRFKRGDRLHQSGRKQTRPVRARSHRYLDFIGLRFGETRDMEGPNSGIGNVIAVIGDGSLSSGRGV